MSEENIKTEGISVNGNKYWMDLEAWKAQDNFMKAREEMINIFIMTGQMPTPEMAKEIYAKYD